MKKLLFLLIIPFLGFGQCVEGDLDNDGICDEIDNCVGTWIADVTTGNCEQFTSQGANFCNSYSGCEWTYSWGGWVTGGSNDCLGIYEVDNGYCNELTSCDYNDITINVEGVDSLIGWNIAQDNGWATSSGALGIVIACIQDGCWNFNMYDGGGDGWEETYYNIYYTNTSVAISSGTLPEGNFCGLQIQIGETMSCPDTFGCTDLSACNYNCLVNTDDASCEYAETYYDCYGNCLSDWDMDTVCDELDNCPEEYNPNQGDFNFNDIGDSCEELDLECIDYDESMSLAFSSEVFYPYSLPGAGCENGFSFLTGFGYSCDSSISGFYGYNTISDMCACTCSDGVVGCTNISACNYNSNATIDNGSCLIPGDECVFLIDLNNDVLEYGILDEDCGCLGSSIIEEILISKNLIKKIDFIGRETINKGLQLEIYDDGSVEKKYLIK